MKNAIHAVATRNGATANFTTLEECLKFLNSDVNINTLRSQIFRNGFATIEGAKIKMTRIVVDCKTGEKTEQKRFRFAKKAFEWIYANQTSKTKKKLTPSVLREHQRNMQNQAQYSFRLGRRSYIIYTE